MRAVAAALLLIVAAGCSSPPEPASATAPLSADAGPDATPDGPMSTTAAACLPPCYFDTIAGLAAACPASGPCWSNTDRDGVAVTLCLANGVKIGVLPTGNDLTTTFKKNGGDLCYTLDSHGKARSWKDAAGKTVLEVEVLDPAAPNLQRVTCGGGPPIYVDLDSPPCRLSRPDAGLGQDGGEACPHDPGCKP